MKQKIAIGVIVLIIVLLGLLLIFGTTGGTKTKYFENTNYPVTVAAKKSSMKVTVNSYTDQDVPWNVYIVDDSIASIEAKGAKKKDSEKYLVKPLKDGVTFIHMEKTQEAYGYTRLIVSIDIPISVTADGNKLTMALMEGESFFIGTGDMVASDSEFPFIIKSGGPVADLAFVNGINDWTIDTLDAPIRYEMGPGSDGEDIVRLYYFKDKVITSADGEDSEVNQLTEEEVMQHYMEEAFGTPPEGSTYDDLVPYLDPRTFDEPGFVIYDEEGNDVTAQVKEMLYGEETENTAEAEEGSEDEIEENAGTGSEEVAEEDAAEETETGDLGDTSGETEENDDTTAGETEIADDSKAASGTEETSESDVWGDMDLDNLELPDDVILTKIKFSSASLNETVYIDIVIDPLGNLYLSKGDAPN